jgi:hypothetical protein
VLGVTDSDEQNAPPPPARPLPIDTVALGLQPEFTRILTTDAAGGPPPAPPRPLPPDTEERGG